jgi:hypothetical protein
MPASRARDIYRFTVEETIENGDRAHPTLDHTAWTRSRVGRTPRCAALRQRNHGPPPATPSERSRSRQTTTQGQRRHVAGVGYERDEQMSR